MNNNMKDFIKSINDELDTIWDDMYPMDGTNSFENIVDGYERINDLWGRLFSESNFWFAGQNLICQNLGEAIIYFDTDIPEQQTLVEDLIHILRNNTDDVVMKKLYNDFRIQKMNKDFKD